MTSSEARFLKPILNQFIHKYKNATLQISSKNNWPSSREMEIY